MQMKHLIKSWRNLLTFVALNFLNAHITYSVKGFVQEVHIDSKFECKASHRLSMKASSEIQCVQRCAKNEKCELLNYNYQWKEKGIEENCEIYMLSRYDSSCKTAPNMKGWKAAIFKDKERCRHHKYNYCFPCYCGQKSCTSNETSFCKCTEENLALPDILISFESTLSDQTVAYDRGADSKGNSIAILRNASVGPSEGKIGNVLRLVGIDPAAIIGKFGGHPLNNPNNGICTISFWIKLLNPTEGKQTVFVSGMSGSNSGFLVELKNYGRTIYAEFITNNQYKNTSLAIGNVLKNWTHFAMVNHGGLDVSLYLNGILLVSEAATERILVPLTNKSHSVGFGVDEEVYPLSGEHYAVHIDDFCYWSKALSVAAIKHTMDGAFVTCLT
ncbi:uncharacterized protein LOC135691143 [Rhopilema esculentum]|uniref:uncharacterized protein LOC135691143 n=1 Tax=Rhopilema esculentum TaxID=499914 RepID=UPI0031D0F64C